MSGPQAESFIITPDYLLKAALSRNPDRRFVASTVRPTDVVSMKWEGGKSSEEQIRRAGQWIMISAQFNAKACASNRERLYRKAKSPKKNGRGFRRVTDRKRLKHLRDGMMGKAAGYANDADDIEEVTDHPALDLLARPNPLESGGFFKQQRFLDKELCGNWFAQIIGDTDGLYRLAPNRTSIIPSRVNFIDGYRYGSSEETKIIYREQEVVHFKHAPSPFSVYLGWGWVQAIIMDADRYSASTQNDLSLWLNNARPDWMLVLPEGSGEEQAKQAREQVNKRFRGPQKNREFLVTTAEDVKPLQWSPRDLEGIASRQDAKEIILAAAGVPLTFVELSESNLASSKTGHAQYSRETVLPRLCRDADDLTFMILPRFGLEPGEYWFGYDNPVPDDEAAETDRAVKLTDVGITTINDQLAEMGYDQIDPAIGDVRRYKGVPLDSLASMSVNGMGENGNPTLAMKPGQTQPPADPSAAAMAAQQITAITAVLDEVAKGDLPTETAQALLEAACPGIDPARFTAMLAGLESFEPASIQREADAAQAQLDAAKVQAPKQLPAAKSIQHKEAIADPASDAEIDRQRRALAALLLLWFTDQREAIASGIQVSGDTVTFTMSPMVVRSLERVLIPPLEIAAREGFSFGLREIGPAIHVHIPPELMAQVRQHAADAAQSVTQTIASEIQDEIAENVAEGGTGAEQAVAAAEKIEELASEKPAAVADVETTRSFLEAREAAWKASGEVWGKRWICAPFACEFCLEVAKRFNVGIPLGQPFFQKGDIVRLADGREMKLDYNDTVTPPLHQSCRCSIVSVKEKP